MARTQVVEVDCSRCERKETQPPSTGTVAGADSVGQFEAVLRLTGTTGHIKVTFEDLCGPCQRTVHSLLEQIGKRIEGVSPDRKPKEAKEAKPAAPEAKKGGGNGEQAHNGPAPRAAHPATADSKKPAAARSS